MMKNSLYNIYVRKILFDNGIEDDKEFLSKFDHDEKLKEVVNLENSV